MARDDEEGWLLLRRLRPAEVPTLWRGLLTALVLLFVLLALLLALAAIGALVLDTFQWDFLDRDEFYQRVLLLTGALGVPFALWRVWVMERQARTAEQGHVTERFTKAVEQLGATREDWIDDPNDSAVPPRRIQITRPNIEVRLGAIYALERISVDSEHDRVPFRDHIAIMETLCAYVRENAEAAPDWGEDVGWLRDRPCADWAMARQWWEAYRWREVTRPVPRADVDAALKVLGRRSERHIRHEVAEAYLDYRQARREATIKARKDIEHIAPENRLDLRGTDLRGRDLIGVILDCADLRGARMEGADLRGARMEGADLWKANLKSALGAWGTNDLSQAPRADFTGCGWLTPEHLGAMFGCAGTILPPELEEHRPAHWFPAVLCESWEDEYKTIPEPLRPFTRDAYDLWKAARAAGEDPPWVGLDLAPCEDPPERG